MKAIIAGGGTGGHLMPGIAVAKELVRRDPESRILFVGARQGIEVEVVPAEGFELVTLDVGGFKRTGWSRRLGNFIGMGIALARSVRLVSSFEPDAVVGLGGYASFPVMAVATLRGLPRVVMEQNVFPGLANRVLGRRADFVAVPDERAASFFPGRAVVTGNPVRPEFRAIEPREHRAPFTVLVTGGSQGAESINRAVVDGLSRLHDWTPRLRFVHQTGKRQVEEVRRAYADRGFEAEVASFFPNFQDRYASADLVVCRAGATTVEELRASGRAAILIPLPFAADDHQRHNARAMVDRNAAVMIDPVDLSGARLVEEIVGLLERPERIREIENAARQMAIPDADVRIADLIERAIEKRKTGSVRDG